MIVHPELSRHWNDYLFVMNDSEVEELHLRVGSSYSPPTQKQYKSSTAELNVSDKLSTSLTPSLR